MHKFPEPEQSVYNLFDELYQLQKERPDISNRIDRIIAPIENLFFAYSFTETDEETDEYARELITETRIKLKQLLNDTTH